MNTRKIKITSGRLIAIGFLSIILVGTILLMLPVSHNDGVDVSLVDAFFTSTSAVCVTGLVAFDTGQTFSLFGRTVVAILIQLGGLGVTTFGLGFMLFLRKKAGIRELSLAKESFNYPTVKGVMQLIRTVLAASAFFEILGALLCMPVFLKKYGLIEAIGYSLFHSVASFNNAGFDIFGTGDSMYAYIYHVYLNIVTAGLIIFGGLGFFVISELLMYKKSKKLSLHTKVVLSASVFLIAVGALCLKLTEGEGLSWLGAFFTSVSARTAGFSTFPISELSNAGIVVMIVLMVIGASPGSTGGGIKTTTAFVLVKHLFAYSTHSDTGAFKRKIPEDAIRKAFAIIMLAVCVIMLCTVFLCVLEPHLTIRDILFEVSSAFGTVGLSTGITSQLCDASKLIIICTMFIGRLGPLTIATLWINYADTGLSRAEESIQIG